MTDRVNEGLEILKSDLIDREVLFGERYQLAIWLKNKSSKALCVRAVWVRLQPDTGWVGLPDRMVFKSDLGVELLPDHKILARVPVVPPLDCLAHSNFVDVTVDYGTLEDLRNGHCRQVTRQHLDWLLVKDVPAPPGTDVFVSFKDQENEDLAQLAVKYLRRAGLSPYLARDDRRCGCDYWEDKITPAIRRSAGVLVIWSSDTVRRPDSVLREIGIARGGKVPVGLFLSNDVAPPAEYPADVLEYVRFDPARPHSAFADGIAASARRWRATSKLF